ncbi:keratin, type I cytoskeletal 10-like [Ctenocephalides felis]|uniref:keratin, type I cytoskeletal 10-like n=1 Tax=Ctenocephalides felis TaxID=7515 RepID=UPI000E6E36A4|nr:keratin, type I cytoskeletal 10-like [Ctenocephalides felis]
MKPSGGETVFDSHLYKTKKITILVFGTLIACCMAGHGEEALGETQYAHNVEHKHASSHQSFSQHHFHAVPVYVKHEDAKLLHHPIELGGIKHNLKVLHPETKPSHDHGATIENHRSEFHPQASGHDFGGSLGGHGGGSLGGHGGGGDAGGAHADLGGHGGFISSGGHGGLGGGHGGLGDYASNGGGHIQYEGHGHH